MKKAFTWLQFDEFKQTMFWAGYQSKKLILTSVPDSDIPFGSMQLEGMAKAIHCHRKRKKILHNLDKIMII